MKNEYVKVVFTRELTLPRFTKKKGDSWMIRRERLTQEGFTLGGGFVHAGDFEVCDD